MGDEEKKELAGHAPATKVGGMRVKAPKRHSESHEKEEKEEPNPNDEHKTIISGVVANETHDFPKEAVKAFHEKPKPTITKDHAPATHHIQQPRKQ